MVTGSDLSKINRDNMNNVRQEADAHFGNKTMEYPKDKINESPTKSINKNIRDLCRGINEFKVYQPSSNFVKDGNGELINDSHILIR
jgi:hypothetical protein